MSTDGLALLVVLGLGGLVLWYLTKTPTGPAIVLKKEPPCVVGYSGISATCGAIEQGGKLLYKGATLLTGSFLGFGGKTATPEQAEAARIAAQVGGCGGWRGACLDPLKSETQATAPIFKPIGFR